MPGQKGERYLAIKEYMLAGNPITSLEAGVVFGAVGGLRAFISKLRKEGWVIESRSISFALAVKRVNEYAVLQPPSNLPIKEIQLTEYWINR